MIIAEEIKKLPHWEQRLERLVKEFKERFGLEPELVTIWKWNDELEWKLLAKYETSDGELVLHEDYGWYF